MFTLILIIVRRCERRAVVEEGQEIYKAPEHFAVDDVKMLCLVVDLRTNQSLLNMLIMWLVNYGMIYQ